MTRARKKKPEKPDDFSLSALLGSIDLPTLLHRSGVLLRVMRGESSLDIAWDQQCAFTFAERLQQLSLDTLRASAGCMKHAGCPCPVCAFAPIQQSNSTH